MSSTSGPEPDEAALVRYLVGRASAEEAERLDELSVVDEAFAERLSAVEHDLVDAYASGELTGDTLEGFRAQYLRSPAGLAQVEFAQALRGYRSVAAAEKVSPPDVLASIRSVPFWQLAAAVVVLAASGYLLVDDFRLRLRMSGAGEAQAALEERVRQLQDEVNRQQTVARATEEELTRAREELAAVREAAGDVSRPGGQSVLALVLRPATRDPREIPQLAIPDDSGAVILLLPLVAVEFAQYEVVLRDAASDRVIWRSERLGAPPASDRPMIPVTVGATLLPPRVYSLELTGIPARGDAEPLDTYPFRVVP